MLDLVGFGDGAEDNNGHGTHVAGSVLGNGVMSGCTPASNLFPDTCFAGMAPKANLVFQAVADDGGSLSGIPVDLNDLFSQAATAGADLHTNSWGSDMMSMYTANSEEVDQYMWDHKDFLILFAASNDGTDLDEDGVIDLYSLGAPATAKNCLTVGASEGNRPTSPDGALNISWGTGLWSNDYPVDPINSDHVSDDPAGVAAFSSRGPVIDGRYKPDILAPGSNILSTKSALGGTGWGAHTGNSSYIWMGGTSMATPLTAGVAALMREYLIKEEGFAPPSAALIKAALLNSAEDIAPGQYGTGATQEIPNSPVPNNVSGWGRVNLWNGVYPAAPYEILFHDENVGLNTGGSKEFTFSVKDGNAPLNVNLVWTDYPGSTVAQGGLVNDLDFQVIGPATTYYPDNALQSAPLSTLQHDNGSMYYFFWGNHTVRFTPSSYPAIVDSVSFYFYEDELDKTNVDIVVYDDNGTGGLPGTELYRKTLNYLPSGYRTIGISGVSISSGDFYVAIEQPSTVQGVVGYLGNASSRSYMYDGSDWVLSDYTYIIRANVRGLDYSTNNDRVNNAVGLSLNTPPTGAYTVRVSGYNIPQGPQPYALVISGDVSSASSLCGVDGSGIDWDGVDNTGGLESTDSCFTSVTTTISGSHVVEGTGDLTILYGAGGSVRLQPNFTASGTLSIRRE